MSGILQEWFNKQNWMPARQQQQREQIASRMGTGLTDSRPLTLAEQFNLNPRMQSYMDHLQANDETEQKDTEILNNIIRDVGMPPKYFFERNILQNMQQNRARSLYEMYRNGGI